jgi:hypothetical protein
MYKFAKRAQRWKAEASALNVPNYNLGRAESRARPRAITYRDSVDHDGNTAKWLNVRSGSFASVWPNHGDFRSTPVNGHSQDRRACLKSATSGPTGAQKTDFDSSAAGRRRSRWVIYIGLAPDPILNLKLVVMPSLVSFMNVAQAPFANLSGDGSCSSRDCLAIRSR